MKKPNIDEERKRREKRRNIDDIFSVQLRLNVWCVFLLITWMPPWWILLNYILDAHIAVCCWWWKIWIYKIVCRRSDCVLIISGVHLVVFSSISLAYTKSSGRYSIDPCSDQITLSQCICCYCNIYWLRLYQRTESEVRWGEKKERERNKMNHRSYALWEIDSKCALMVVAHQ